MSESSPLYAGSRTSIASCSATTDSGTRAAITRWRRGGTTISETPRLSCARTTYTNVMVDRQFPVIRVTSPTASDCYTVRAARD